MGGKGGALTTTGGAAQPAGWKQVPGDFSFNVPDGCRCFNSILMPNRPPADSYT